MNLSGVVKHGAHQVKVLEIPHSDLRSDSMYASACLITDKIEIPAEATGSRKVELFFHEMLHVFLSTADLGAEQEERACLVGGEAMMNFLANNKAFMMKIIKGLK